MLLGVVTVRPFDLNDLEAAARFCEAARALDASIEPFAQRLGVLATGTRAPLEAWRVAEGEDGALYGIGFLAVDGPGTGQSPIKVSETAERALSRVLDYLQTRPEVDKTRIAIHGVSWGAYWATKMAIVERSRLRGASAQSPPVDTFFQKDFLMSSLLGNREYLFDQVPALMAIFDHVTNLDEMAETLPKMSLVRQGLLGKPMAPMLVMAGVLDTQVPISDIYLLLSKGDVPKTAWINPQGGHLGRQVKVWPDPAIFKQVIIPWLVRILEPEPLNDSH